MIVATGNTHQTYSDPTTLDDVELFAVGTHTDSAGNQRTWTEQDLHAVATTYNAQKTHQAPAVIGHPRTDDPAFGWLERVWVKAGRLLGRFVQVQPEFREALQSGLYKMRSIALYPDLLIRHVGFLGAQPPAVKGLAALRFEDSDPELIVIEFGDATTTSDTKTSTGMTIEEQIKKLGETVDTLASELKADKEARKKAAEEARADAGDSDKQEEPAAKDGQKEGQKGGEHAESAEMRAMREQLTTMQRKVQDSEFSEFLNGPEMRRRITPAMRPYVLDQMRIMAEVGQREFSDNGTTTRRDALETFKDYLKRLPVQVEFGETAAAGSAVERQSNEFAEAGSAIAKAST